MRQALDMKRLLVAVTAMVIGCGAPLEEGAYNVELIQIIEETCGLSDEDYGLHESELIDVQWDGDTLVFTGAGDAVGTYAWDGEEGLSATASDLTEIEGTSCSLRVDRELEGTIRDESSFVILSDSQVSTEGDCSDVDTTGIPCSASLLFEAVLVE